MSGNLDKYAINQILKSGDLGEINSVNSDIVVILGMFF